jgi:hypothetical protein
MTNHHDLLLPENLRIADLIAKTARVTLKDTLRVLAALDAVSFGYDVSMETLIDRVNYEPSRPTPEQVAACEQEFFHLRQDDHLRAALVQPRLDRIKALV